LRSVIPLALLGLALISPAPNLGSPESPAETRRVETVAPGVEHIEIRRGDFTAGVAADRWTINVLTLDPRRVRLALGRAFDGGVGVETTSSIAARHGALAAVNGGYFRTEGLYRGEPAGIVVRGAKVLSEPSRRRPGLAVSNADGRTKLAFASLAFRADVVAADGSTLAVSGLNRPRLDDELILFTPEFHLTTLTGPNGIEAVVAEGLVVAVHDGAGSRSVPPNGYVLSAHGLARRWVREHLRPGGRVELRASARFEPALPFDPEFVLGGGPVLLRAGGPAAAADAGEYAAGFRLERHPRTAVGARADGTIVLVVVDGRQPALSAGMTIDELAALLTGLGCVAAINLDGGGSTTMVVRGRVVNQPSDAGGERPVGDALLVLLR
jgi:exopolysaccharide biosynthesis protein